MLLFVDKSHNSKPENNHNCDDYQDYKEDDPKTRSVRFQMPFAITVFTAITWGAKTIAIIASASIHAEALSAFRNSLHQRNIRSLVIDPLISFELDLECAEVAGVGREPEFSPF